MSTDFVSGRLVYARLWTIMTVALCLQLQQLMEDICQKGTLVAYWRNIEVICKITLIEQYKYESHCMEPLLVYNFVSRPSTHREASQCSLSCEMKPATFLSPFPRLWWTVFAMLCMFLHNALACTVLWNIVVTDNCLLDMAPACPEDFANMTRQYNRTFWARHRRASVDVDTMAAKGRPNR